MKCRMTYTCDFPRCVMLKDVIRRRFSNVCSVSVKIYPRSVEVMSVIFCVCANSVKVQMCQVNAKQTLYY